MSATAASPRDGTIREEQIRKDRIRTGATGDRAPADLALPDRPRIVRWFAARPRIADIAVMLACALPASAALLLAGPEPAWLGWACIVGVAVALWWRRQHPLAVLLVIAGVGALNPVYAHATGGPVLELAFGMFALASRVRLRTAVLGALAAAGIIVAVAGMTALLGIRTGPPVVLLQPSELIALAAGVAVRQARERRKALAQVVALREERAAAAERARITAEMHDVVAHSVTVMVALAGGAAAGWEKYPERAREALGQLGDVGADALGEMQRILRVLRHGDDALDRDLERAGHNLPDLGELIERSRHAGLPAWLTIAGELPADPGLATTVYRIVQESLTNALRHARGATHVEVRIAREGDALAVSVTDNGRGDAGDRRGAGVGLRAMRERAHAFGGELAAGPLPVSEASPGSGWQTRALLPLNERHP
ncbi:sensor histidine kinase [Leucobacter albus]|uniref:sensor histidine kinase n=1 Tax=Leucobacter albus TaxID=272210 RepID=UPI00363E0C47